METNFLGNYYIGWCVLEVINTTLRNQNDIPFSKIPMKWTWQCSFTVLHKKHLKKTGWWRWTVYESQWLWNYGYETIESMDKLLFVDRIVKQNN